MRVEQLLSTTAARLGHKPAIVAGRASHSYADLDRKSDRLAAAMTARGIGPGDRVAVFLDHGCATVVATFAVLKAGAVLCPVAPGRREADLADILVRSRVVGVVTGARLASVTAAALAQIGGIKFVVLVGGDRSASQGSCLSYEDVVSGIGPAAMASIGSGADPAIVLHGIGPDGQPACETFTHRNLTTAVSVAAVREDATVIAARPISSQYGLYQMLAAVKVGATQVLVSPFAARAPLLGLGADNREVRLALAG